MEGDIPLLLMSQMLKAAVMIAAPILGASLVVGLIVSVFQVVTQIQEMTLTFVPKLIAAVAVLIMLGHWMLSQWRVFATELITAAGQF
ncbi:flagellar biosynthetic protein FliQ [Pleionea sediminis]|uniref:flagellar biosynthetic protein FliQ n=1 Tax=Pleionea sediminis TaxID=2569479 RepID=UPI00118516F0|nr:flagellar biosynthetic protein FliQ [Pleionea sediminis]